MRQRRRTPRPRNGRRLFFTELEARETISDTILGPAVLASTLYLADRVAPLALALSPATTQVDKVDVSSDARRADVLTSLLDGLPWWNAPADGQHIKRGQQAFAITADLFAGEQDFFPTLDEELAALFAVGFGNPGSATTEVIPNAGGLINNAEPLLSPLSSTTAGTSDASSSPGVSSTSDGSFGNGVADEEELLYQSAALGSGKTSGAEAELPAPPAGSAPPSRPIPPRRRTTGPSRPARPRGSLAFGGGTAGVAGSGSGVCCWTTYGEASVDGTTVTLGVADRLESETQAIDVHGASMLLPAAGQYTIYFDVDLSTWDAYNANQGEGTGTGYWDSFSVSITSEPYPYALGMDPLSLPFVWGGQTFGDGIPDTRTGPLTITVPGNPIGDNYLNVVLDTYTQPDADVSYPSWGWITIARVATNGPNIPPGAVDDTYTMLHDTTLIVEGRDDPHVLFNDCNLDGNLLTARLVSSPAPGTLSFNADGTFTYTPPPLFTGQVTFSYVANDGTVDSNPATVTIDVINNAPVAQNDNFDLEPNTSLTVSTPGVFGNDYDPDGDLKTREFVPGYGPASGTLDYFDLDGSFKYTPNPNFVGTDTFAYKIFDGIAYSSIALVTLLVSPGPRVSFWNFTRTADRVVSARDLGSGRPGGIKTLEVWAYPTNAVVDLRIVRTAGTSGSAVFQDTQTDTKQLTGFAGGRYPVTIEGRDVSDQARNMRIEARIDNVPRGSWDFTVFEINLQVWKQGKVTDIIPESVENHDKEKLRERFLEVTEKRGNLGHNHVPESLAWGGIVIRGNVRPSGMLSGDFNRTHSRTESFNWNRKVSGRIYDRNGCISTFPEPEFRAQDERSDDLSDVDEDLTPNSDGEPLGLSIWVYDVPRHRQTPGFFDGEILRTRWQFTEHAQYAGVRVSSDLPWYWRSSRWNPAGDESFVQNNAVAGDNRLETGLTTPLTPDLGPSAIPEFTVVASTPATAFRGQRLIDLTIDGTLLNSGAPCQPVVHFIRETPREKEVTRTVIPTNIIGVTATRLTGVFGVPAEAQLGTYILKVFIGDKAQTRQNALDV